MSLRYTVPNGGAFSVWPLLVPNKPVASGRVVCFFIYTIFPRLGCYCRLSIDDLLITTGLRVRGVAACRFSASPSSSKFRKFFFEKEPIKLICVWTNEASKRLVKWRRLYVAGVSSLCMQPVYIYIYTYIPAASCARTSTSSAVSTLASADKLHPSSWSRRP